MQDDGLLYRTAIAHGTVTLNVHAALTLVAEPLEKLLGSTFQHLWTQPQLHVCGDSTVF